MGRPRTFERGIGGGNSAAKSGARSSGAWLRADVVCESVSCDSNKLRCLLRVNRLEALVVLINTHSVYVIYRINLPSRVLGTLGAQAAGGRWSVRRSPDGSQQACSHPD